MASPDCVPGSRRQPRILIVAGEASGDLHAANLIAAIRARLPQAEFFGIGGRRMREQGCRILVPCEEVSAMGLVEPLLHLRPILRAFRRLKRLLRSDEPPDLLITIDFQEFNLKLARAAKRAGVPVLHYVSPQVWAWRPGRTRKVAASVNKLAVIFPFEPACYDGLELDVRYVGHPLLDDLQPPMEPAAFRQSHGLEPAATVVGLFPGSRQGEIRYNLGLLADTARLLQQQRPELRFLLPVAPSLQQEEIQRVLAGRGVEVTLLTDASIYDVAAACDAIASVSGTVTLQIALVGTPLVILYRAAELTYRVARRLVKLPWIGLPNIVAGRLVVRELIQQEATPTALAAEIRRLLEDQDYRRGVEQGLAEIRSRMGEAGGSARIAQMAVELLSDDTLENQ